MRPFGGMICRLPARRLREFAAVAGTPTRRAALRPISRNATGDTTKLWITVRVVCRLSTMTALGAYAIVGKVFAGGTRETYVPAQEATQAEAPRISRADAHARWTKRVEAPEGKGTPPGFDLTPNAVSTAADGSRGIPPGLSRRHANRERADRHPRHLARARTGTRRHRRAAPDRGGCAAESSQAADPGGSRPNVRHA